MKVPLKMKNKLLELIEEFETLFNVRISSDMCILSPIEKSFFKERLEKIKREVQHTKL